MSGPVDPRLLRQVPACRHLLRRLAALQVTAAVLVVAQASVLADAVVRIATGGLHGTATLHLTLLIAGVLAARALVAAAQEWLTLTASTRIRAELRRSTLDAIARLGPMWVARQPPGRLVTATGAGLDALDGYVTRALPALVAAGVVPGIVLARIIWADWRSGLVLLLLIPLVPLFMTLIGIVTKRRVEQQYAILARLGGHFLDLLRGLTTLRVYGRAAAQEQTLRSATERYRAHTMQTLRTAFLSGLVLDLLAALSVAVVAVDVGLRLAAGHIPFATGLLVLMLAPEVFAPLRALGAHHHASHDGATAAGAALDIVDEAGTAGPAPRADHPLPRSIDRIEVVGLTVAHPGRALPALRDVTLDLRAGEITALTGTNGAGKSTLLHTLLRFLEPQSGAVEVHAADRTADLAALDADAWRSAVAWLPQRPRPSRPTVADELRMADSAADDATIAEACRACRAPSPATPLAEDGRSVSAGQRRRIALARVLVRVAAVEAAGGVPVVLLDEPSEDLDAETEAVVGSVLDELRSRAVVVVATHSDALVGLADRRITLHAGDVVADERQTPARPTRPPAAGAAPPVLGAAAAQRSTAGAYRLRDLVREGGAARRVALASGLSGLTALFGLGLAATSMWLISRAAQHPNVQALAVAVVGVRTFAIGRALLRYGERLAAHDGALRMLGALRVRVFAALRELPHSVLADYGRGDLLRRFVGDVDGAQEGIVRALVPLTGALAGAVAAVCVTALLAPAAGMWLLLGLLAGGALVPVLAYRAASDAAHLVRAAGSRDRRITQLVDSVDELHAYGMLDRAITGVADEDAALLRMARRPAGAAALGVLGAGLATAATMALVTAAAAQAAYAGRLPVVDVGVLVVCVLSGFDSVSALPGAFVAWARCRAGLLRVAELTGSAAAFADPARPHRIPAAARGLRGSALSVAPAAGAPQVVRDASFELPAGQRLVLVGPSGCGKSTLLGAVLRMLPVESGAVAITGDGADAQLGKLRAADVPPIVAGSLQGDHVFDATLRDNLRVVRPAADDAELDRVAQRAGLLGVVRALPAGWATPAGPDGAALSGGQRQRLLLARALLADPAILVLDEPTAHLDADVERQVLADLFDATRGRTVLCTSHSPVTAAAADEVIRVGDLSAAAS